MVRMHSPLGLSQYEVEERTGLERKIIRDIQRAHRPTLTLQERMEKAPDLRAKRLTALLAIQMLMVLGEPIPKELRDWEHLAVASPARAMKIREAIRASGFGFEVSEYFVVLEVAPALLSWPIIRAYSKHPIKA